jgi:hypothetical protein
MTPFLLRKRHAAVLAAAIGGSIAIGAGGVASGADALPEVSILNVVSAGGGPPSMDRVGQLSVITGRIEDTSGNGIGSWRWRCTYIGGAGTGSSTSHFCRFTIKLADGTITTEGGYGAWSNAVRWQAVIGGTGKYRGVTGVQRLYNLNSEKTPDTYYLIHP